VGEVNFFDEFSGNIFLGQWCTAMRFCTSLGFWMVIIIADSMVA
jgi:hypothetical protein